MNEGPVEDSAIRVEGGIVKVGTVHPPGAMFLRTLVGEAALDEPEGPEYEMALCAGTSVPLVRSKTSGRVWSVSWADLLTLARNAGVDETEERE